MIIITKAPTRQKQCKSYTPENAEKAAHIIFCININVDIIFSAICDSQFMCASYHAFLGVTP